jgi:hypothetical protein
MSQVRATLASKGYRLEGLKMNISRAMLERTDSGWVDIGGGFYCSKDPKHQEEVDK